MNVDFEIPGLDYITLWGSNLGDNLLKIVIWGGTSSALMVESFVLRRRGSASICPILRKFYSEICGNNVEIKSYK